MATFEEMKTAMEELDDETLVAAAEDIMANGGDASVCMQACQEGLEEVGHRFENGEYFVGDLVFAGELMGGSKTDQALKSGLGSLLGFLLGTVVKCVMCAYFCWEFVKALV